VAFTYDLATDVGKVRLLIGDTTTPGELFQDGEIQAFLDLNGGTDVFSAAADAVLAILADKALLAKVVAIGDYSESSVSVGQQLRSLAADLRERAQSVPADGYAETIWDPFSHRTKLLHERLQGVS